MGCRKPSRVIRLSACVVHQREISRRRRLLRPAVTPTAAPRRASPRPNESIYTRWRSARQNRRRRRRPDAPRRRHRRPARGSDAAAAAAAAWGDRATSADVADQPSERPRHLRPATGSGPPQTPHSTFSLRAAPALARPLLLRRLGACPALLRPARRTPPPSATVQQTQWDCVCVIRLVQPPSGWKHLPEVCERRRLLLLSATGRISHEECYVPGRCNAVRIADKERQLG
ncbi:hypothetical protein R5R35_002942 [Gryllus longicercus]|uniref:Uncharacterized protein n=1 Tax=Gryllus longicercus TaxID=2509291 RepID=A0AAN9WDE0_9ORTH